MLPRKLPPARFFKYIAICTCSIGHLFCALALRAAELMPRLAAGITSWWSAVVVAASTRDAENVGVAVVVCMRDSYSDPTAVRLSSSVSVDRGSGQRNSEAFMSEMNEFLCCYVTALLRVGLKACRPIPWTLSLNRLHCSSNENT